MSLEEQINRLANVISMSQEGTAVAEIIRQRDEALTASERRKQDSDWYQQRSSDLYDNLQTERRRTAALRAYIKRLKAK